MSFHEFPRTIFADKNTLEEQMLHIMSEVCEVFESSVYDQHMELADLAHSIQTYKHIQTKETFCWGSVQIDRLSKAVDFIWETIRENFGEEYCKEIFKKVEKKNQDRGYYG
jgi:uncharacterized protein YerC